MQSWTTAGNWRDDPFAAWGDHLAEAFVRLEPARVGAAPFFGRIVKADAGDVAISRVDASAHGVGRLGEHISSADPDIAFVNLQISGVGLTAQAGQEVRTGPSDIAIADTRRPFAIRNCGAFALYSIAVPSGAVPRTMAKAGAARLSCFEAGRQIARMVGCYARFTLHRGTPPEARALCGRHIVDLLVLAAAQMEERPAPEGEGNSRLAMMLDHLTENFADPGLSADKIARLFGVSTRYVHKLFSRTGASFSEHLAHTRLDAAAGLLRSRPQRSITDVALDCGFSDPSYFNRMFKSRLRETPSAYRRRAAAGR